MDLNLVVKDNEWTIDLAEETGRRGGWLERTISRVTGPPAVVSGLAIQYWATHGKTWPTSYSQLDVEKPGVKPSIRRVKTITFRPVDEDTVIIEMLYDTDIPATITLNVEVAEGS